MSESLHDKYYKIYGRYTTNTAYNEGMKVQGFQDTVDWYNQHSHYYSEATKDRIPNDLIERFLSLLPKEPNILDAGCGPGWHSGIFAEKGAQVTGVDISEGLLIVAQHNFPQVNFIEADFRKLPSDDNTFDGVWAHASLVHLETAEDVVQSLKEFRRVLKTNGILHIYVKKQIGEEKTAVVSDTLAKHERFFRYFSEEELRKLLGDENFEVHELQERPDPHGREEIKWFSLFAKKSNLS